MPQNVFDQFDEETVETNVFDQFDAAESAISPVEAPDATWGERAADIGIDLAKGTVGFGQSVVGLGSLATGGYLSDGMRALGYNPEQTNQFLSDMYSEARKAEEEKISKAEGFAGTVKEIVSQPGALLGKIAETTPMMLGSIAAARLFAAKAFAAAEAEALAAGATKAAASKVGLEASAKAATAAAATAEGAQQAGMSFDDYMDKGIDLGKAYVASIGSGITTGLTSLIGGRIGQKFGLGDVEAGIGGKGGIISRAAKGGVQEGVLEEMPQSSMEQMWNNYANERPIMEGVPEAAGTGLTVGFGAGTGFGAFQKAPEGQTDQETKPPETFSPTHNVSGGVAAEQAAKNGRAIPDTYIDAAGKIIRDANAVPIPIPEYDPESYDLEQNAAAIEADVETEAAIATGAPTAEGRQEIIESVYGPSDFVQEPVNLRPLSEQEIAAERQAEIDVAPMDVQQIEEGLARQREIDVTPEIAAPVEEPAVDVLKPVSEREEIDLDQEKQAGFEAEAIERGITEPDEINQYVLERMTDTVKTPEEIRQKVIDREIPAEEAVAEMVDQGIAPVEIIEEAAGEAATSELNDLPEPTQLQKEAGNYKKGKVKVQGFDIAIENPAGSKRQPEWPTLKSHYGYIKGSVGADSEVGAKPHEIEQVDVFVKPDTDVAPDNPIYVIDQYVDGVFDEHKLMTGYDSIEEARIAYNENYTADWDGLKHITEATPEQVKEWIDTGDTTKEFSPEAITEPVTTKTEKERALAAKAKGVKLEKADMVRRGTLAKELVEEPTVTPEEITELPAVDYAKFDGKEITYEVEIEETGETYTVTADAGKEMRGIDARIESLNELMKCVS